MIQALLFQHVKHSLYQSQGYINKMAYTSNQSNFDPNSTWNQQLG